MHTYWLKRGDWIIGPISDFQLRAMTLQKWFRDGDEIRIGEEGIWGPARVVLTTICVAAASEAHNEAKPREESEAQPEWFRRRTETSGIRKRPGAEGRSRLSDSTRRSVNDGTNTGSGRQASPRRCRATPESDLIDNVLPTGPNSDTADSGEILFATAEIPISIEDDVASYSNVGDEFAGGTPPVDEIESNHDSEESVDHAISFLEQVRNAPTSDPLGPGSDSDESVDTTVSQSDLAGETPSWDDASSEHEINLDDPVSSDSPPLINIPDVLQIDRNASDGPSEDAVRTDWEIGKQDQIPNTDSEESKSRTSHKNVKSDGAVIPESALSAELDFESLARLASLDPRVSTCELPSAEVLEEYYVRPEERALRRSLFANRFQSTQELLFLTIGIQSFAISVGTFGLLYGALKRLFLLSMEVFIPFGYGSGEVLEGSDLALSGIAMATTFALPFLPLSYLHRMDGRVAHFLVSLLVALIATPVIYSGDATGLAGAIICGVLFAAPSGVIAVLCGILAADSEDLVARRIFIAVAVSAALAAGAFTIAAPSYGIANELQNVPSEFELTGFFWYGVLLTYALQLSLVYMFLKRVSDFFLDEATRGFVNQHLMFHWSLTATAFVLLILLHTGTVTGWASGPVLLAGMTAIVALGFNLWSLTMHIEPWLSRMRAG